MAFPAADNSATAFRSDASQKAVAAPPHLPAGETQICTECHHVYRKSEAFCSNCHPSLIWALICLIEINEVGCARYMFFCQATSQEYLSWPKL